ncbi:penicillin-binding protein 1A [Alteromonas sediminis]|uniref:Penicillin-binding protein 1A n=1 Tax=Alteromonas sediminis TaxID=2259342 RepID=A0A3N5Y1I1_9ALTE|nr:penicillin-binding protein 1A [Alteromonas sediminis]RPJ66366.1 penicillin-binding protein 1A [Alteromonas sediminis]
MRYLKRIFWISVIAGILGLVALLGLYFSMRPNLPSVEVLKDVRLQTPMRIYTKDGKLISQYGVQRRIPVTLDQVPEKLKQAIIATEDSRFYDHFGIDPIGVVRAAINLIVTGEKQQGASTLTMQLARGFFLTREKAFVRKIKEAFIALHIEQVLTKEEILLLYINKVELGHRAFGMGAAAQVYYGKSLDELTLAQLATLAGLPQAPSVLNPISRPERSVDRRRIVLFRMLDEGFITRAEYDEASNAPVTAEKHGAEIEVDAPYLADIIYNQMVEMYGKEEAETGGYRVYATANSETQLAAQNAVTQNLHDYDERHGFRGPIGFLWGDAEQSDATVSDTNEPEPMVTNRPSLDDVRAALSAIDPIEPLFPAVVLEVMEQAVSVMKADGEQVIIEWINLDWAREYITDSRQGSAPEKASDILSEGAIIWIREHEGAWRLSQLPEVSGAFVALNPFDGAVEAVVGGYSFYQSQFNRATQAKRQVGSNIKPFIYASALDSGYTVASVINDAPINQWNAGSGTAWRPQNSPAEYDGPIRMRVALGKSKNVVSIRLLRGAGLHETADYLRNFGFLNEDIPRDETLSLGSGSHTPLEVARAMAVIANGGFLVEPHFIHRVENEEGQELWQSEPVFACDPCQSESQEGISEEVLDREAQLAAQLELSGLSETDGPQQQVQRAAPRVMSEQTAFLVADMLRTAVRTNGSWNKNTYWMGTGWRARNILGRADIAGKTGTTNDSKDTWFTGFSQNMVATSWVGFDDMSRQLGRATPNRNIINRNPEKYNWIGNGLIGSEDGAKAAQPAWIRFMQHVMADLPETEREMPQNIIRVRIDRTSGLLTRRTDHTTMFEYFIRGTQPTVYIQEDEIIDPALVDEPSTIEPDEIF